MKGILWAYFLETAPNKLIEIFPGEVKWANAIRVIDASDLPGGQKIYLNANTINQRVISYLTFEEAEAPEKVKWKSVFERL